MNGVLKMMKFSMLSLLLGLALGAAIVAAQTDQSGYISIDCGRQPENSEYLDRETGIYYNSDAGFIDSGVSKTISPSHNSDSLYQQYLNLRSFPQGKRNCYTLKPKHGKNAKYLIRASFLYGDYDGLGQLPKFDIHLGVEHWDTILFVNASVPVWTEIVHIPTSDYISVCLVKTGPSTPFISTLELRSFNKTLYPTQSGSLLLYARVNFNPLTNKVIRYKDDPLDRLWSPFILSNTTTLSTESNIESVGSYELPSAAMSTAATPTNSSNHLGFNWEASNATDSFYVYMHFAEVVELKPKDYRAFNIYINDVEWFTSYVPYNFSSSTVYSQSPETNSTIYNVVINKTANSTLPPIINGLQIYTVKEFTLLETFEGDVNAMQTIKSTYEIENNWQGDPCSPIGFEWDGVTCVKDGFNAPRITALNLSSNGLDGTIASSISNLTMLKTLDLSHNNLTGMLPDFLAQLNSLKVLKLEGNNFTGPYPPQLLEKARLGNLQFSIDDPIITNNNDTTNNPNENIDTCQSSSCKKDKKNIVVPIVASIAGVLFVILVALVIAFCMFRRKKQRVSTVAKVDTVTNNNDKIMERGEMQFTPRSNHTVETISSNNSDNIIVGNKSRQFSYHEVLSMTNNFQRVIGKGGFGTVYHGYVGESNAQVAVKMLSQTSTQGYKEFQAEANLLLTIHHRNLTSLVGYCYEGTNMGIIYEYMANGNVEKHLLGKGPYVLTWEERLRIAIDAGQGLEYLHHGCIPSVVHRDVKTTNILLDEKFTAKLADFGLSRAFPIDDGTQVSTMVAGTPGYLDPEYYSTSRLTEKSDVYSFGIILLEIVTGRTALPKNNGEAHIISWVSSELENGDIESIIDPKLRKDYAINSVWKVVELAMSCVARNSARRPTMNSVVVELKGSLEIEMSRNEVESNDSIAVIPMRLESTLGPQAR